MATTSISTADHDLELVFINLHNETEFAELKRQRVICGWDFDDKDLLKVRAKQDEKSKLFWWMVITPKSGGDAIRAGHVALDNYALNAQGDGPEVGLDEPYMNISALFVLPEYRAGGLGRQAMDMVEAQAPKERPELKYLTLNAISKRYMEDDSEEWRGMYARLGIAPPAFSNEVWYTRRGYVKWKEEPRYNATLIDGTKTKLVATSLKKQIQ